MPTDTRELQMAYFIGPTLVDLGLYAWMEKYGGMVSSSYIYTYGGGLEMEASKGVRQDRYWSRGYSLVQWRCQGGACGFICIQSMHQCTHPLHVQFNSLFTTLTATASNKYASTCTWTVYIEQYLLHHYLQSERQSTVSFMHPTCAIAFKNYLETPLLQSTDPTWPSPPQRRPQ